MTIYADVLFLLNAALDWLMLAGSARLAGSKMQQRRMIPAACIGGIYAVASVQSEFLSKSGLQWVVMALMLLCAFGAGRKTLRLGLLFLGISAAFAGLVLLCVQLAGQGLLLIGGTAYYPVSLTGLLLVAAAAYLAVHLVFTRLAEHTGKEILCLRVTLGSRSAELRALRDTGNTLKDPLTGQPVLILGREAAAELLPELKADASRLQTPAELLPELAERHPELRFRLLPYRAVGTDSGLLLAARCRIEQKGKKPQDVLAAFSPTPVSDGGSFNALTGG